MGENLSTAVRNRRVEPHNSLDDYPTAPWATRALFDVVPGIEAGTAREPCANRGHMVRPLAERYSRVFASDIFDYGAGFEVRDFLFGPQPERVGWTIFNPPFRLAVEFIEQAMRSSAYGVAALARLNFLEGGKRYTDLFKDRPPTYVLPFAERLPMLKGVLRHPNLKYWDPAAKKGEGAWKKPSTATAYAWFVWTKGQRAFDHDPWGRPDPRFRGRRLAPTVLWVPPGSRKRFEREGDYPEDPTGLAEFNRGPVFGYAERGETK